MTRPSKFTIGTLAVVLIFDIAIFALIAERVSKYGMGWIWQPFVETIDHNTISK